MKKLVFVLVCSLIAVFAIFASPILAIKQIQLQFNQSDSVVIDKLNAAKICLGTVCRTDWTQSGFSVATTLGLAEGPHSSVSSGELGVSPRNFALLSSPQATISEPIEGTKLSIEQILGAPTNSGWVYMANIVPDANGITFWASITKIQDNTGLLYGITDASAGTYYSGFLPGGTIETSQTQSYMASYSITGKLLLKIAQIGTSSGIALEADLPWPSVSNPQRRYTLNKNFSLSAGPIWESGDGVIPMSKDLLSWYLSFVFDKTLWVDIQKFNVPAGGNAGKANHRWGAFILQQDQNTGLPRNTAGVWWEILDSNNNRQAGGFTNFDLFSPYPGGQQTRGNFEIQPIETYNSGNKTYLKKWRLKQDTLGVDLLMETVIPNQENNFLGLYIYEGAVKVFDPATGVQIGTGMLEQTHSEQ